MSTLVLEEPRRIARPAGRSVACPARSAPRLAWIDALRGLLAVLVVAHHAGQPYGGGGDWPVLETARSDALGAFFAVNAAFFMGLFFLIAGSFLPGAYDRVGSGPFLRDRVLRLGAPLVVFGLAVFGPITFLAYRDEGGRLPFGAFFVREYLAGRQVEFGHLWFLAHLLVYATAYVLWRRLRDRSASPARPGGWMPGHRAIVAFTLALAALTFLVRIRYPIDRWERLLGIVPAEPAHLPQYLSLVVIGVAAGRGDWLRRLPAATGFAWLRIGLAAVALRYAYASVAGDGLPRLVATGGADWRSLVWSAWEAVICVGLCIGLLTLARERLTQPGRLLRTLGANSYAIYVVHIWALVPLQVALVGVALPPLAKFALVCLVGIPLSVAVAALGRRLPGVRRLL